MLNQNAFQSLAQAGLKDSSQRKLVMDAVKSHELHFERASEWYANLELARERAAYYKWKVTESLDKYLIEFESNVIRRGGKVIWAMDAESALQEVDAILKKNQPSQVTLAHSGVCEEIGLKAFLAKQQVNVLNGSYGDYIATTAGKPTFQMVSPAMNFEVAAIAELLNQPVGVSLEADAENVSADLSQALHESFSRTDLAITGANFLIAENGMVTLCENEGNIRLSMAFARTHLVIAGIDKVIPSINELDLFLPLLATYSSGQHLTAYNTIAGPRQPGETEGPNEFIVILVDNGRSELLAQADQRQSLSCIQCGACSMVCPVFASIGGYAFKNGPLGAVTAPHKEGIDASGYLSYVSTGCGKCTGSCPVKIELHNHILRNRRDVTAVNMKSGDKMMWFSWKKMMLSRKNLNRAASVKQFILKSFFKTAWGEQREFPKIVEKSFNQQWRERHGL